MLHEAGREVTMGVWKGTRVFNWDLMFWIFLFDFGICGSGSISGLSKLPVRSVNLDHL
jgi:hypothetical protein